MKKRILAIALTIAMTVCLTMTALADVGGVSDADLEAAGLNPDTAEVIASIEVPSNVTEDPSPTSGTCYSWDGETLTIDFSSYDVSAYDDVAIFHILGGGDVEWVKGTTGDFDSASPFKLIGSTDEDDSEGTADDDDGDDDDSSSGGSSSGSKHKSPKTGMDDSWMLWLMAAGVFAGASVVTYNRKWG